MQVYSTAQRYLSKLSNMFTMCCQRKVNVFGGKKKYLVCKLVFSNAFGFCYLILAPLHSYFVRSQKSYVVGILACGYYLLMWNSIFPLEVNRDLAYMTRVGVCGSKFQLDWFNLLLHS